MSKKLFSNKDIELLSKNKYVKNVSEKGITYNDEFKKLFIIENQKGKLPRDIFVECGFDIELIGLQRIKSAGNRWRSVFRKNGIEQLKDTRKFNSGRTYKKSLSLEEEYKNLKLKLKLLKAENELLKKLEMIEGGEKAIVSASEKFEIIKSIITKYKLKNRVSYLCNISEVSRSGYYRYLSSVAIEKRKFNKIKDLESKKIF